MNKKKLSVVMAGAMLASSVAPVLAAEEVSVTEVQKGTLINELTDKIWDAARFSKDKRVDSGLVGKSVLAISIDGKIVTAVSDATVKNTNVKSDLQKAIQTAINALSVGEKVELVNLGSREVTENGKTLVLSTESTNKYSASELSNTNDGVHEELNKLIAGTNATAYNSIIETDGNEYVAGTGYVITLTSAAKGTYGEDEIVLTTDSDRLDFTKYISSTDGSEKTITTSAVSDFGGFAVADAKNTDIANKVEATYKIASDGTTLALSDIFDGVMLTEKGQALLNEAKTTKYVLTSKEVSDPKEDYIVKVNGNNDTAKGIATAKADKNGVYTIKVQIADANKVSESVGSTKTWTPKATQYNTYYITGTSKAELTKVLNWIDELSADVDVLAGSNRYETAVKIAKEVASLNKVNDNGNIVLVNGDSLVDGLSAAPLAASKSNAPILLTESDKLPTATKKYLSELVDKAENKTVTVNIVGGKSVVSTAVEKELRALGLKVDRFGGDNREETSMAVAEEVANGDITKAFVVGAEGEADAMSIAGYAADTTTPIIVAKKGGITEDTVEALDGATLNVIGGENAVSAADYASLKDVALTIARVSGSNRKATNAAVINKFYGGNFADADSVIVAKDGQNNKSELIDALAASNLASVQHAPVVLGTNNLSADQIDAIAKNAKSADKVYQVGYGVERNVVKLVAQSLGLI